MIKEYFEDIKLENIVFNADMSKYTTFKTGGLAKVLVSPINLEELLSVLKIINKQGLSYTIIGNGSNILFTKDIYDGVVIRLSKDFSSGKISNSTNKFSVSAGTLLVKFAKTVCSQGYKGFEFATGIPGTVGGAVYMNAGCYGGEIVNCCTKVVALNVENLELQEFTKEECEFTYRNSFFQNDKYIIISAEFEFELGEQSLIDEKVELYKKQRTEKQPLNIPNAGSTFKRPLNDFAGRLIEEAGLKGHKVGGAQVSEIHAGFIVNIDKAKPKDIIDLVESVQERVLAKFGIKLELEIKVV